MRMTLSSNEPTIKEPWVCLSLFFHLPLFIHLLFSCLLMPLPEPREGPSLNGSKLEPGLLALPCLPLLASLLRLQHLQGTSKQHQACRRHRHSTASILKRPKKIQGWSWKRCGRGSRTCTPKARFQEGLGRPLLQKRHGPLTQGMHHHRLECTINSSKLRLN